MKCKLNGAECLHAGKDAEGKWVCDAADASACDDSVPGHKAKAGVTK